MWGYDDISVDEDGLDGIGSAAGTDSEFASGTVADDVTGGVGALSYTLQNPTDDSVETAVTKTGAYGVLTLNQSTGAYTYELTGTFTHPSAGEDTANNVETFTVDVVDANGNSTTVDITVDIVDDVPTATNDVRNNVEEGSLINGNVVTDPTADTAGADGFNDPIVVGVAAGDVGEVAGGAGVQIETDLGFLTLNADGGYSYQSKPDTVPEQHPQLSDH